MLKVISNSVLAISLLLGTAGGFATVSHAQDMELRIGPDGVRPVIRDRDRDRNRDPRFDDSRRGGCSERDARAAARASGLRDPEVTRTTRSRIVVEGMTRRGPDTITFANERGCPEL